MLNGPLRHCPFLAARHPHPPSPFSLFTIVFLQYSLSQKCRNLLPAIFLILLLDTILTAANKNLSDFSAQSSFLYFFIGERTVSLLLIFLICFLFDLQFLDLVQSRGCWVDWSWWCSDKIRFWSDFEFRILSLKCSDCVGFIWFEALQVSRDGESTIL